MLEGIIRFTSECLGSLGDHQPDVGEVKCRSRPDL